MPEHDLLDSGVVCEHGDDGIAAAGVAYPSGGPRTLLDQRSRPARRGL
jgi:hypothetical protein